MGLKMTLPRECNNIYTEFKDAYWALSEIAYDMDNCYFVLSAYPSREVKLLNGSMLPESPLPIGGVVSNIVKAELYRWKGTFDIQNIFPEYIPLNADVQKTMIYNFIKGYTRLPFEDVFEDDNIL